MTDADLDNDMDLLVSGNANGQPVTIILLNANDFSFEARKLLDRSGKILKMADLDQDGRKEMIVSGSENGQPFLSIYKHYPDGWRSVHDSLKIVATAIEVFDFDNDWDNDFFISGRSADNTIVSSVFNNNNNLYFTESKIDSPVDGTSALGDLNHDGNFDIIVAGKNVAGQPATAVLFNVDGGFRNVKDSLIVLDNTRMFAADFNSNGKCDVHFYGVDALGDTVNTIVQDNALLSLIPTKGLVAPVFGDFDRDGDLDLLQIVRTGTHAKLTISENKADSVNLSPVGPFYSLGVAIFNRVFIYWEEAADDHTPTQSLTFDLSLQTQFEEWVTGEFDMINYKRLTASHGNTGNRNFVLLRSPYASPSGISYAIQSIDNALHAGNFPGDDSGSGICRGTIKDCTTIGFEYLEVCKNEMVRLQAPSAALWFSFSKGLLGNFSTLGYQAVSSDTLFYLGSDPAAGCTSVKVFVIKISESLVRRTLLETEYVCEGVAMKFGVENGWQNIAWKSLTTGFISNSDSIVFTPLQNDTLTVTLSNGGCLLERRTPLIISKPLITVNAEAFQILKGEQVQLFAEGGESYLWTPSEGLNSDKIANPLASPFHTTQYVVTVTDTAGCAASAKVLVIVEGTAFIPNLFTPNDDGKNDALKIYGLNPVKDFTFTIHNREGSIVYETRDIQEATVSGWNGTVRGNNQPSGVYYWKVKGEHSSGRRVLLNGKSSGSIVLIR